MSTNCFFLLVAALFIVASAARPATKDDDLITSVCSKTTNPTLCTQVLQADPRSAKADLKGLGFISLDIASSNGKQTINLVSSLLKSAKDPNLKTRIDTCLEEIQLGVSELDNARDALSGGDIGTFRTAASAALTGPSSCDDEFEGPPAEPPQLLQADTKLKGAISIVLAVGALLDG